MSLPVSPDSTSSIVCRRDRLRYQTITLHDKTGYKYYGNGELPIKFNPAGHPVVREVVDDAGSLVDGRLF